jgi:uncharacterized protein (TIGR04255 family)
MVKASLGQLPNAPLAYVLGAVKFAPQLSLSADIPNLQKRLQIEFPRFQTVKTVSIPLNSEEEDVPLLPSQRAQNYEFASADNRYGVILNRETLVFHATAYTTYEDFEARMVTAFEEVGQVLKHLFVRRIGLRYIDVVIPDAGESPDDYVSPGLRCMPELSLPHRQRSGLAISEFQMAEGALVVRYAVAPGRHNLPPDLQSLRLDLPAIMQRDVPQDRITGLLDFDRFFPLKMLFDIALIKRRFGDLHDDLSMAFRELTTEHAKQVWKQEVP